MKYDRYNCVTTQDLFHSPSSLVYDKGEGRDRCVPLTDRSCSDCPEEKDVTHGSFLWVRESRSSLRFGGCVTGYRSTTSSRKEKRVGLDLKLGQPSCTVRETSYSLPGG